MYNVFSDAFKIVNFNLLLVIPLIIFIKLFDIYTMYVGVDSNLKLLIASVTVMLMFSVFFAGWFYMIKGAVELSKKIFVLDSDRAKESMRLFKLFLEGVGKFFLPFIGVYLISFVIQLFFTIFTLILGLKIIGTPDAATMQALQNLSAAGNNAAVADFVNGMSPELIKFFGQWSLLFITVTFIILYFLMFWAPEIFYSTKNPVLALCASIYKNLKKFPKTILLYVVLWIIGFAILFLNTFSMINPFLYLFVNLLIFYFNTYIAVCIFLYYDRNLMEDNEK